MWHPRGRKRNLLWQPWWKFLLSTKQPLNLIYWGNSWFTYLLSVPEIGDSPAMCCDFQLFFSWQWMSSGRKGNAPRRVALPPPRGVPSFSNPKTSCPMDFEPSVEPYYENRGHVAASPPATTSTYDNQVLICKLKCLDSFSHIFKVNC